MIIKILKNNNKIIKNKVGSKFKVRLINKFITIGTSTFREALLWLSGYGIFR